MLLTQEYNENWSPASKVLFRFLFTYISLYIFLLFTGGLFETPFKWVGWAILGFDYTYEVSGFGSGDNTYAYVVLFVNIVLALIIVPIWSLADSKRKSYNRLFYWFTVVLRIILTGAMFLYGFVKIFQLQFPYPSLTRMLEPLGNFSPMGLAWTYMGYSEGFNMFAGLMEVLGGILLIPRRTQTMGAFIVMGVMTHVAVMNFMFDIPVKLFSIHLVLLALVIFSTDFKRFVSVFIKNEAVAKYEYYNPVTDKTYHKVIFWMKGVGLLLLIGFWSFSGYMNERSRGNKREKPYLYGIWEAKTFIKNKDTLPPLLTDSARWHYLIIDQKGTATVKTMGAIKHYFSFKSDTVTQKIKMHKSGSDDETFNIDFSYPNYSYLEIEGVVENDSLHIIFSRKDVDEFLLHSRGFHWINEQPLNK